jgi:uncharacterized protein (TIGR00369 family)
VFSRVGTVLLAGGDGVAVVEEFVIDAPENVCFGCSPHNERGLRMRFRRLGPGLVESHYNVSDHLGGAPGVVHGGIQAVLLDEAMGVAIHQSDGAEGVDVVTAEFKLRYRRPVLTQTRLVVRGELLRSEGRDYWVEGAILDADGQRLTVAEARWRRIDR